MIQISKQTLLRGLHVPAYQCIQLMGIVLFALIVFTNRQEFASQGLSMLRYTYIYTVTLGLISYLVSYADDILTYVRGATWEHLGEVLLVTAISTWGISLTDVDGMIVAVLVYALITALWRRRVVSPSIFQWASIGLALYPLIALLWTDDVVTAWPMAEQPLLIGLLAPAAGLMALSREQIARVVTILFRIGFVWMTLQVLCYLSLSDFYGINGWMSALTLDKYYSGGPETPPHVLFMHWTTGNVPAYWCMFLGIPLYASYFMRSERPLTSIHPMERILFWGMLLAFCFIQQTRYGFGIVGGFALVVLLDRIRLRYRLGWRSSVLALLLIALVGGCVVYCSGFLSDPFRWRVAAHAIDIIRATWPTGMGVGMDRYVHMELFGHTHSHNSFLTAGVDAGILGIGAILLWFTAGLWTCMRQRNGYLLALLLLILPSMLLESPLYHRTAWLIALWIFLLGNLPSRSAESARLNK